jgi:hypothetical protein
LTVAAARAETDLLTQRHSQRSNRGERKVKTD